MKVAGLNGDTHTVFVQLVQTLPEAAARSEFLVAALELFAAAQNNSTKGNNMNSGNHKQFYTLYFEKGNQSLNQSLLQVSSVTDYLYSKYTSHNSQMCICRVKISGNQSLCNRKTCGSDRHLADCNHKPCKNTVNNTVSQHS